MERKLYKSTKRSNPSSTIKFIRQSLALIGTLVCNSNPILSPPPQMTTTLLVTHSDTRWRRTNARIRKVTSRRMECIDTLLRQRNSGQLFKRAAVAHSGRIEVTSVPRVPSTLQSDSLMPPVLNKLQLGRNLTALTILLLLLSVWRMIITYRKCCSSKRMNYRRVHVTEGKANLRETRQFISVPFPLSGIRTLNNVKQLRASRGGPPQ